MPSFCRNIFFCIIIDLLNIEVVSKALFLNIPWKSQKSSKNRGFKIQTVDDTMKNSFDENSTIMCIIFSV